MLEFTGVATLDWEHPPPTRHTLVCALTGRGWSCRAAHVHLPVVEGAADHGVLARLQHHVAAHKLLHRPLAVGQQAPQCQLVAAAEGGAEHHDAQVQQVAVGSVRAPAKRGEKEEVMPLK